MENPSKYIHSKLSEEDSSYEEPLRPSSLDDFKGQKEILERLDVFLSAAKKEKRFCATLFFVVRRALAKQLLQRLYQKRWAPTLL